MDQILGLLSGGIGGAVLVWVLRGWITERLKQSISYEYSEKLEGYKNDLNTKVQAIQHDSQLNQLRTSLFFEHQRNAFAALLSKVAEINNSWFEENDPDAGSFDAVPRKLYQDLKNLYHQHQLFMDDKCLMAFDLLLESYSDSFPYNDSDPGVHQDIDPGLAFDYVEYIYPRVSLLFKQTIGVADGSKATKELALLGAMKLLNRYYYSDIELPPKGVLKTRDVMPFEVVSIAQDNFVELIAKLQQLKCHIREKGSSSEKSDLMLMAYIEALNDTNITA
jgi:hypothetical protein